jgi:Holliday junction resolvase-like predicted endonuclease
MMTDKSFKVIIEVSKLPHNVFRCITEDVDKWWGGKDFKGNSLNLHDEFIINHPGAHYSKQKLAEVVPDKKIVWLVKESKLYWLKNQDEWTNTRMIFDIISKDDNTILHFSHEGLTPDKESYVRCSEGWNMVIKDWLFDFITNGKPHFKL